jgi:hypothetical protein
MPLGGALTVGLIGAGTSLLGGIFGSSAAKKAAQQQKDQASGAAQEWRNTYKTNQDLYSPYTDPIAGGGVISSLTDLVRNHAPGQFQAPTNVTYQNDPGYQFRMQQGQKALEQSAAARGGALGGGELKALTQYGQNYGSNEYSNVYNRALQGYQANNQGYLANLQGLLGTAGLGLQAAGLGVNANNAATAGITNAMTNYGNASAAGTIGSQNAWNSALGGIASGATNLYALNQLGGSGGGGGLSYGAGFNPGTTVPALASILGLG